MHVFCIFVFAPVQRLFHMERRCSNTLIMIILLLSSLPFLDICLFIYLFTFFDMANNSSA